jgi:hypothetical protein
MRDNRKEKMDTRTEKQVQEDMVNSINELQDAVGVLFPWRIAQNSNEVVLSNNVIQLISKVLKLHKGETS